MKRARQTVACQQIWTSRQIYNIVRYATNQRRRVLAPWEARITNSNTILPFSFSPPSLTTILHILPPWTPFLYPLYIISLILLSHPFPLSFPALSCLPFISIPTLFILPSFSRVPPFPLKSSTYFHQLHLNPSITFPFYLVYTLLLQLPSPYTPIHKQTIPRAVSWFHNLFTITFILRSLSFLLLSLTAAPPAQ